METYEQGFFYENQLSSMLAICVKPKCLHTMFRNQPGSTLKSPVKHRYSQVHQVVAQQDCFAPFLYYK